MNPQQNNQYKFAPNTPDWAKPHIIQANQKYGVPTDILSSQIFHESGYNPKARNQNKNWLGQVDSTDRGIAQINSKWHPEISDQQADDPNFAIDWMAQSMSSRAKKYNGDWAKALSEYNTGNPTSGLGGYAANILRTAGRSIASDIGGLLGRNAPQSTPSPTAPPGNIGNSQLDSNLMQQGYAAQAAPGGGGAVIYSPPRRNPPPVPMATMNPMDTLQQQQQWQQQNDQNNQSQQNQQLSKQANNQPGYQQSQAAPQQFDIGGFIGALRNLLGNHG